MKNSKRGLENLFFRYFLLVIIALPGLVYFYYLFLPLTLYPVYWILSIFYSVSLHGHNIFFGCKIIEIVGACVAGSAYYFLLMLNLSIPNIKIKKRISMIVFSFLIFLIINIIRIVILGLMYLSGSEAFEFSHKLFWYLGSTLFVVLIWFLEVKVFNIKGIPFYTDLKTIYDKSSLKGLFSKRSKTKKKKGK